jgi:hypothetical protein
MTGDSGDKIVFWFSMVCWVVYIWLMFNGGY